MKSALKIMEKNLRKLTLILICLSKKSKCLFCSVDCNLKRHLQSSEKCSKNYIDKFEKPNIEEILQYIEKVTKSNSPSVFSDYNQQNRINI